MKKKVLKCKDDLQEILRALPKMEPICNDSDAFINEVLKIKLSRGQLQRLGKKYSTVQAKKMKEKNKEKTKR